MSDDFDARQKLKEYSDRQLLIHLANELRYVKRILCNHLHHHEIQDDRRWKLFVTLSAVLISSIVAVIVALL